MNKTAIMTPQEQQFFQENGYLIKRNFVDLQMLSQMQKVIKDHLVKKVEPFELEQEVNYPGSPKTLAEKGGDTIRRLLLAYGRHDVFKQWAKNAHVLSVLAQLFKSQSLFLVQSHHNCIMTKQPEYSSETHWHKDIRYWNFQHNFLINTWLPLGDETVENGCLQVIPGTHKWNVCKDRLDKRLFLRKDLKDNQKWLDQSTSVTLNQGDLLFFHASLFHAAGRNHTQVSKNAVVFTYHTDDNAPIEGSKSVKFDEIALT